MTSKLEQRRVEMLQRTTNKIGVFVRLSTCCFWGRIYILAVLFHCSGQSVEAIKTGDISISHIKAIKYSAICTEPIIHKR